MEAVAVYFVGFSGSSEFQLGSTASPPVTLTLQSSPFSTPVILAVTFTGSPVYTRFFVSLHCIPKVSGSTVKVPSENCTSYRFDDDAAFIG